MQDINRGKLCTLKTLLEGNSQIDPADAASVLGEVLCDEDFDEGLDDWDDNDIGEDK
ncbi:MAG: hypothetical protein IJJ28_01815 [Lentisphaeria bacterium]|nr:hypothetical protein [Lentisphaeria bacterium]